MNRSHQLVGCFLICIIAPETLSADSTGDKAPKCRVSAYWVVVKSHKVVLELKKKDDPDVIGAPSLLFRIKKDGGQGAISSSSGSVAKASIKLHGDSFPVDATLKYEFTDNRDKHFLVNREITLWGKSGDAAFYSRDKQALLLVSWRPKYESPEERYDGSPHRISIKPLTEAVLYSSATGAVFAKISEKEGLASIQKMLKGISFPMTSGYEEKGRRPMLSLRITTDNNAIFLMTLSLNEAVFCGLKSGARIRYPLRGDRLFEEILPKHGIRMVEDERFLGGTFSVYRDMPQPELDPSTRPSFLLLVHSGRTTHLTEFTTDLEGTVEIRCDEERERCWLVETKERRIVACFDHEGAIFVESDGEIPKWARPSSGRVLRSFSVAVSK